MVPRQPHRQTKDDHMTTDTTQTHITCSKSERNLITLQASINGIKNKFKELKLLIHDTHADIITIQETKLTPITKNPKVHNRALRQVAHDRGGLLSTQKINHASHPAGPHGRFKKGKSGPHCWGREVSTQYAQQFLTSVPAPLLGGCVVWWIHYTY